MEIRIDSLADGPRRNLARLVEDLAATLPLLLDCTARDRPIHPPSSVMQSLGEGFLELSNDKRVDVAMYRGFDQLVDAWFFPILGGRVRLSYFLMSVVLGREDVRTGIVRDGQVDWTHALRWLVLHGIGELQLWPYLTSGFVAELRSASVPLRDGRVSPLELCLVLEQPQLLSSLEHDSFSTTRAALVDWLVHYGARQYDLFWLLSADELLDMEWSRRSQYDISNKGVTPGRLLGISSQRLNQPLRQSSFGERYPCASVDMNDPETASRVVCAGDHRLGIRGGTELLSVHSAIQFPVKMNSPAIIILEMLVPEILQDSVQVKFKIGGGYEDIRSASEFNGPTVHIFYEPTWPRQPLEIIFLSQYIERSSQFGIVFGLIKSLRIWQQEPTQAGYHVEKLWATG